MEQQNPFLENDIDIRAYFHVLHERKWVVISLTVIWCTLSLIYSFMMVPIYRATTQILLAKEAPRVVSIEEVSPDGYADTSYYQTQYKIMKSRALAERVNNALGGYQPWNKWSGRELKRKEKNAKPLTDADRITALLDRVEIKPTLNTQLVAISVEDIDPKLAAKIANLWAESYISYVLDAKFDASQYASGWLQDKVQTVLKKLEQAEKELQEYRRDNKGFVESVEKGASILQKLMEKKAELEIEFSENLQYYKEKHPEVIGLKSEIESVNEKINAEKEKELKMSDERIQYNILSREVETSREIYGSLLKRIGETEVTGALKITNISVIDRAIIPKSPVKPRKQLNFLIAFLVGSVIGTGLIFFLESVDQSLKTPEDIKKYMGLPDLASIPLGVIEEGKDVSPEFITTEKPHSTISESYRSLRTSILFTAVGKKRDVLLLTSAGPQEGKTTTAINLAIVMAQAGEKTILVDADLRKPRIEQAFNIKTREGLSEILSGMEKIDNVIHETGISNLEIITCGSIPPNPSELLGSKMMDELLGELCGRYDRIIIDSPPVLAVTDAVILSGKTNGTIIVVQSGKTNRNAAIKTKEMLAPEAASANIIGVILNMAEVRNSGGHHYYYQYYGKKHGYYTTVKKAV